jgi:hypothetical protein
VQNQAKLLVTTGGFGAGGPITKATARKVRARIEAELAGS